MRFVADRDTLNDFFIWALAKNADTAATQLAAAATIPAIAETQAGASVATRSITRFIPQGSSLMSAPVEPMSLPRYGQL
jgi:hypothetical protein